MNLHIDPAEFSDVIHAAVDEAVARLQAERNTDDAGRILLSKAEAAKALGVSPSTLDRLRRDAGLSCVKLNNGLVLFRPESLKAWAAPGLRPTHADVGSVSWKTKSLRGSGQLTVRFPAFLSAYCFSIQL